MAASNIVVDKHSPDEFDKLSLPENLGNTTDIQQGRTYFLAGSVLSNYSWVPNKRVGWKKCE
jgi:hypothetical protein